ncbi:DUF1573 domain-containing protein [Fluviicola taffensis]|uniref:DUF1573 domain-containing protein n=1 Tax=Fluviicola taffensis (strain DSM 16823 / NCIMB 13979 / RW262) TaxID=755732 RepID=F2IEQ0_FLUTR|nr:DUF1573 domain-containing protein [Fluviicola taffensis]AEA45617.1 protein of unknown function DUF1573 [Fluviicola taffensis DSM 16823]
MKKRSLFIGLLLVGGLVVACSNNSDNTGKESELVMEVADDPETIKANEQALKELEAQKKEEAGSITIMKIDKEIHDFGKVTEGVENHCTFVVTNTGNKPLILSDVKASCGCTTPSKPEGPIAPGKSDKIEVGFKPSGKGVNEKTITITANTEPRITVVKVKADVQ